jgi:alpha-tubulin suppressor-like RCC1 family protein
VVAIASGDYHCLALKRDGTVVAWGLDSSGQCDVPSGLRNVAMIAARGSHSMVLVQPVPVAARPVLRPRVAFGGWAR